MPRACLRARPRSCATRPASSRAARLSGAPGSRPRTATASDSTETVSDSTVAVLTPDRARSSHTVSAATAATSPPATQAGRRAAQNVPPIATPVSGVMLLTGVTGGGQISLAGDVQRRVRSTSSRG